MKTKELKQVIKQLPKTSDKVEVFLKDPSRFNIEDPEQMSIHEFLKLWESADDCFQYLMSCTSDELMSFSDLLTLMIDGSPINDCYIDMISADDVGTLEISYSTIILFLPHHDAMYSFINSYRTGEIKPTFKLKKLVKALSNL